ncbi:MAG: hypothetical protein NTY50_00365 [Methylobacter sp.]|nr:hypothetical protein [Methylobacter sp.]
MGWTQIVTWLLVISGWLLVNHQNNVREKRKEIRTILDKTQSFLDEVEIEAIKYHTSQESSDLAFQLKRSLNQKLRNRLDILALRNLNIEKCYPHLKKLRQAVTLENFDTSSFKPQNLEDDVIKNIWLAKDKLSQELEKSFATRYR